MSTYTQAVAEARQLVKRSNDDQWRLCELTWEQVKAGKSAAQWARDIGVSDTSTKRWRRIWERWGSVSETDRPTYSEAWNEIIGRVDGKYAEAEVRNMPPERKAELARELLAEPEVADKIVDSPETRVEVHKALDRQYDRQRPEHRPETVQENPHEADADAYRLLTKLRAVDRALTDAAVLAQNMRGIGARDAAALEPVVERLRGLLDLISSGLSGAPLDVELRALLDAEAGS